ncbi:MAG: hypothetical protein WC781_01285 [Candidatus Pacearchaeota archaeon]|jgi:hypothetical protein
MTRKKVLGLVLVVSSLIGCTEKPQNLPLFKVECDTSPQVYLSSVNSKREDIEHLIKLINTKYGLNVESLCKDEDRLLSALKRLDYCLGDIYSGLISDTKNIRIKDIDEEPNLITAQAFPSEKLIEVSPYKVIAPRILAHEFTHVKAENSPEFKEKWMKLIKSFPSDKKLKRTNSNQFPFRGFMTMYGSNPNFEEVIATSTFPKRLSKKKNGKVIVSTYRDDAPEYIASIYHSSREDSQFIYADPNDEAYTNKLKLLREYNFMSPQQYSEVLNELGINKKYPIKKP